jgi:hypothetical protein
MSSAERRARAERPSEFEEQEVDFGRHLDAIVRRWWLPLVGIVLGIVIGLLVTVGRGRPYQASAIVYLGQPYAPGGAGTPIQSLGTKLGFVKQLATSRSTLRAIAAKTGVRPGRLDGRVAVKELQGVQTAKSSSPTPLVAITVDGFPARKEVEIASAVADYLVRYFSTYAQQKLSTYKARLARNNRELVQVAARTAQIQQELNQAAASSALPETEKLLVLTFNNGRLQFLENRQTSLESSILGLHDLVALNEQFEQARVVEPAAATRQSGPSRRASVAVGAVIGLVLGLIAALLWEPVAVRVRTTRAES